MRVLTTLLFGLVSTIRVALPAGPGLAAIAGEQTFDFTAPAIRFTVEEKSAQRDLGQDLVRLVREAYASGEGEVTIPPGEYRFGNDSWGKEEAVYVCPALSRHATRGGQSVSDRRPRRDALV